MRVAWRDPVNCCSEAAGDAWRFHGRVMEMVDGWTVTMADSEENQEEYPQLTCQKPGCGFPIARMVGVFSLATGAVQLTAIGGYNGKQTGETSLLRSILDRVSPGTILLASAYRQRWLVELHIRSLKTQMQMNHLRCQSPQMVRKEAHCHMIGYNLVRDAMLASALKFNLCRSRLSFTGAMQAVEEFASSLRLQAERREAQWENLLATIAELTVGDRPGRQEPREIKRRPKNYKLMQSPRDPNRNRFATAA